VATRWFVQHGDEGEVLIVARIRQEADGVHPETWTGTAWQRWTPALSYLVDPLAADEVGQAEAETALQNLWMP
jgi:hypothetical protein